MPRLTHAIALLALSAANACHAAPVTLAFTADGFTNVGTAHPGFDGPVSGSITWDAAAPGAPVGHLTAIDLVLFGHRYTLADVAIANEGTTQTALGALPRGANAVVGDGAFDDFLLVFDRVQPHIAAFAYSLQGKANAIWWSPATTRAWFVTDDTHHVPEPSPLALAAVALGVGGLLAWRRRGGNAATATGCA